MTKIVRNRFVTRTFVFSVKMRLFFDFQTLCHFLKLLTLPIISFENLFEIIAISYFLLRRSSKKCYEYVLLKNVSYYLTNNLNFTLVKVWEIVGFNAGRNFGHLGRPLGTKLQKIFLTSLILNRNNKAIGKCSQ